MDQSHGNMDEEFDLSPLLMDVCSPFPMSPTQSPAAMPEVVTRPISKRRGKKRSSRACTTCRARKVRCNIVAHGAPCSNCRHDEIDCVLPLSRRQRSARERAEASLRNSMMGSEVGEGRSATVEFDNCSTTNQDEAGVSGYQDRQWERAQSQILGPHGIPVSEHILSEVLPPSSINSSLPHPGSNQPTSSRTISWIQLQSPLASAPFNKSPESQSMRLPRVFTSFPRHIGAADLAYLQSRDALTLPSEALQLELLKAYIEFVHCSMPILDLEDFLSAVKYGSISQDGQRGRGIERENALKKQIPFLLFQAVMFAGVGFVSMSALRDAGYHSRETARRMFFSRVRLCYDFDTCTDRQSIIQALLLMTTHTAPPAHDSKDSWHWLGLAISLSYSLGLNRGPSVPNSSLRKKRLERRIWWTAFMQDRTLALNDSGAWVRAVRIRKEDCDVPMLELEDFDLGGEGDKDESPEEMRTYLNAKACVERSLLCWCSSDALITGSPSLQMQPSQAHPYSQAHLHQQNSISPQHIFIPSPAPMERAPLSSTPYENIMPIFENQEDASYRLASESSPSLHEDCPTPMAALREERVVCGSPDMGHGVDGEYDDYLEYLYPSVERSPRGVQEKVMEKRDLGRVGERPRETWAFQLDCENDRVLEV